MGGRPKKGDEFLDLVPRANKRCRIPRSESNWTNTRGRGGYQLGSSSCRRWSSWWRAGGRTERKKMSDRVISSDPAMRKNPSSSSCSSAALVGKGLESVLCLGLGLSAFFGDFEGVGWFVAKPLKLPVAIGFVATRFGRRRVQYFFFFPSVSSLVNAPLSFLTDNLLLSRLISSNWVILMFCNSKLLLFYCWEII